MIEQWLLAVGSAIFGVLGSLHLIFTFVTDKFDTFNPSAAEAMKATSPRITRETTLWSAWIGFNASHSIGAMAFSTIYLYLTIFAYEFLQTSSFLLGFPILVGIVYLILAKLYWFKLPLMGITAATICFAVSFVLHANH